MFIAFVDVFFLGNTFRGANELNVGLSEKLLSMITNQSCHSGKLCVVCTATSSTNIVRETNVFHQKIPSNLRHYVTDVRKRN